MAAAPPGPGDAGLAYALTRGDEDAFDALYGRYAQRVYDYVARTIHDVAEAEDITQVAFVQMWERRTTLREPQNVRAWIYRIATNLALNHVNRRKVKVDIDDQRGLGAVEAGPENQAVAQEAATLGWSAAASLEPRLLAVLELSVRQGLTNAEIAQVLKVDTAQASLLVDRAREALGTMFGSLELLPLPQRLRTPPAVTLAAGYLAIWDSSAAPDGAAMVEAERRGRRRRLAVLIAAVLALLSAGSGAVALGGVLGTATPTPVPTAVSTATPSVPPTATPSATVAPTNPVVVPPTATPLPPFLVTAISLCFVSASGVCNPANTTLATCTQAAGIAPPPWQCRFRITFSLTRGAGGTLDWSLAGTLRVGCSAPVGVSTGGHLTLGSPSPGQLTISSTLTLSSRNPDRPGQAATSSATVTSPQGRGAAHNTAGFYGTGHCT